MKMNNLSINKLMALLDLPNEIINASNELIKKIDIAKYQFLIDELISKNASIETYNKLKECFPNDNKNIGVLVIELYAMLESYKKYQEKNLDIKIFINTMKCIKRFLNESKKRYGEYIYDRGWWVYRQLNLSIFRIGDLEYELINHDEINIHIPSDALFTKEEVDNSLLEANKFINTYFKEYKNAKYYCESWLLSPVLKTILDDKSNILSFQERFQIIDINPNNKDYLIWVFNKNEYKTLDELIETTSLQRRIKELIKNNINIGEAKGLLK